MIRRNLTERLLMLTAALCWLYAGSAGAVTVELEPNFAGDSATIDNGYWPLPVGYSFGYRAVAEDECEFNKMVVTSDTMLIEGVEVRVVRDQEWLTGLDGSGECDLETAALIEDTLDYFAQDTGGNVWYFGEDTWSWDDEAEACTPAGSWRAGQPVGDPEVDPAQAGILMLIDPSAGDRYQQEFLEDEAEDWAAVKRLNALVSIELGDFDHCLKIKEWTPLEPGSVEHKYYCPPAETGLDAGLLFIEELKEKTLTVEYIGATFPAGLPGDGEDFPALEDLGCGAD